MSEIDEKAVEGQEPEATPTEGGGDPLVNLKSEFARKLANLEESARRDKESVEAKLEQILTTVVSSKPTAPVQSPNIKELLYEDPDRAIAMVEERVAARADAKIAQQQEIQSTVYNIQTQYPEFMSADSEAIRLATKKAERLPNALKGTAQGMKLVMLEAAAELGLVPVSKRAVAPTKSNEDFAISGSSSPTGNSGGSRKPSSKDKDVSPDTLEIARLLDPDFDKNPKRQESLKKVNQRQKWNKYQ